MNKRRFKFDIRQAGRRISLILAIVAALNAGFFVLGTQPKVREYTSLREGTGPRQEALRTRSAVVEEREGFHDALIQAESDLTTLREDVLATREARMIEVQLELKALADKFQIDVETISFDNEVLAQADLDKLVMTVPLEGGYSSLRKFLQAIEASEKFLVVERVALGEGKRGGVMLQLSITLATYFDAPEELRKGHGRRRGTRSG